MTVKMDCLDDILLAQILDRGARPDRLGHVLQVHVRTAGERFDKNGERLTQERLAGLKVQRDELEAEAREWRAQGESNPCFRRERATS